MESVKRIATFSIPTFKPSNLDFSDLSKKIFKSATLVYPWYIGLRKITYLSYQEESSTAYDILRLALAITIIIPTVLGIHEIWKDQSCEAILERIENSTSSLQASYEFQKLPSKSADKIIHNPHYRNKLHIESFTYFFKSDVGVEAKEDLLQSLTIEQFKQIPKSLIPHLHPILIKPFTNYFEKLSDPSLKRLFYDEGILPLNFYLLENRDVVKNLDFSKVKFLTINTSTFTPINPFQALIGLWYILRSEVANPSVHIMNKLNFLLTEKQKIQLFNRLNSTQLFRLAALFNSAEDSVGKTSLMRLICGILDERQNEKNSIDPQIKTYRSFLLKKVEKAAQEYFCKEVINLPLKAYLAEKSTWFTKKFIKGNQSLTNPFSLQIARLTTLLEILDPKKTCPEKKRLQAINQAEKSFDQLTLDSKKKLMKSFFRLDEYDFKEDDPEAYCCWDQITKLADEIFHGSLMVDKKVNNYRAIIMGYDESDASINYFHQKIQEVWRGIEFDGTA